MLKACALLSVELVHGLADLIHRSRGLVKANAIGLSPRSFVFLSRMNDDSQCTLKGAVKCLVK